MNRAEIDSGRRAGSTSADAQLERENKELRRANDILKATSRFFAAPARRSPEEVASLTAQQVADAVSFIDAHRTMESGGPRWGVEPICQVLEMTPTTCWSAKTRPPCARQIRDAELGPKVEAIWKWNYSVYGRRKLAKAVRRAGHHVGRDQVARLMREPGIRGANQTKKRSSTHADPAELRAPDLVKRNPTATAHDQLWVADYT